MAVWVLEAYDTELREARSRTYTRSKRTAELFEQVPRIQFTDSGHGIEHIAREHTGARRPVIPHGEHVRTHLARLRG